MSFWSHHFRRARGCLLTIACFTPTFAACGGDTASPTSTPDAAGGAPRDGSAGTSTGGSSGTGTGGSSGTSTGGSSGTGTGGASGTSTGGTSGTGTGGASGTSTGGASGAGTGGASGTSTGGTGGSTADAGTILCAMGAGPSGECARGQYCCGTVCRSSDQPCNANAIRCDEAADCPNAFCCMTKISRRDGGPQNAQCRATCRDDELIMCNDVGSDAGCPPGMRCQPTATLPPLYGHCCPPQSSCPTT